MLGFAPIAASTLGGSGAVREVVPVGIVGVSSSVTLGTVSVSADAKVSDQAERKHDTVYFYDPDGDGVGYIRNNEGNFYNWINAFILGMRPQIPYNQENGDSRTSGPIWDEAVAGDKALSLQTKLNAELSDSPIVSHRGYAPLTDGTYTYPASYETSLGYEAGVSYPKAPTLDHLDETIVNNTATVASIAEPFSLSLSLTSNPNPLATDPYLGYTFNVIIGQVRTVNTYDPSNTATYFDNLIEGQVGSLLGTFGGQNKTWELFKWSGEYPHSTETGFDISDGGTFSIPDAGTDKTDETLLVGLCNYKYIIPDSDSQPMTLGFNPQIHLPATEEVSGLQLGTLQSNINIDPVNGPKVVVSLVAHKEIVTPTADPDIPLEDQDLTPYKTGFDLGTVGLPDPQWYLSTSRVEIVAEPNQPANDVIYPYASRSPTAGPTQTDFDFTAQLGVLASPIAVDLIMSEREGYDASVTYSATFSLGEINLSTINNLGFPTQLFTLQENLSGVQCNVTEVVSDTLLVSPTLGDITVLAESNSVCTTLLSTISLGDVEFDGQATVSPSGRLATASVGEITVTADANIFLDGINIEVQLTPVGYAAHVNIGTPDLITVVLAPHVGIGMGQVVGGFQINSSFTGATGSGFHFDFDAIKHLYNRGRNVHGGFPANRIVNPSFTSPRHIKPPKPKNNLAA